MKHYQFGHKMRSKTWDPAEIDTEKENKKIAWFFIVVIVVFILLFMVDLWLKHVLHP